MISRLPRILAFVNVFSSHGQEISFSHLKTLILHCLAAVANARSYLQGQPFSFNHFILQISPCSTAAIKVNPHQGHPLSLSHFMLERLPCSAAFKKVLLSHGQPFSLSHFRMSISPFVAAIINVPSLQGQLLSLSHFRFERFPFCTA